MRQCIFIISAFFSLSVAAYAQLSAPKYSNEFLNLGVGARGLGMSGAQIASVQDVTAGYWNPAGLLKITDKYDISFMHAEYFAGIAKYDYAGFATPIDSMSRLGLTLIRFGIDDIPDTRFLYDAGGAINYSNIRFFSAVDYAFIVSYTRKTAWVPGLAVGANFKIIRRTVGEFAKAWGIGFDVAAQYVWKKWSIGVVLRDATSTFNAWTINTDLLQSVYQQTGNALIKNSNEVTLPRLLVGGSRVFTVKSKWTVMPAIDCIVNLDGRRNVLLNTNVASLDPVVGMELGYDRLIFLRAGVRNIQRIKRFDGTMYMSLQPDFGLGIAISKFMLDYALTNIGNQGEGLFSHIFSLRVAFTTP